MAPGSVKSLWILLWVALALNVLAWFSVRHEQARWTNVPPAPTKIAALGFGAGDAQMSYRVMGLMIQNIGDIGGRTSRLNEYDYNKLADWFWLSNALDPQSDFMPYLGAFYFGGVEDPSKLLPMIDYLYDVGNSPEGEKFRWMAQAVYLMRYKVGNLERAFEMAQTLANLPRPNLPVWARMMPALVKSQAGEKEAAVAILVELLKSSADKMQPNEVNATVAQICERLLDAEEAKRHPLCQKPL